MIIIIIIIIIIAVVITVLVVLTRNESKPNVVALLQKQTVTCAPALHTFITEHVGLFPSADH
jgi:hypothetical protein